MSAQTNLEKIVENAGAGMPKLEYAIWELYDKGLDYAEEAADELNALRTSVASKEQQIENLNASWQTVLDAKEAELAALRALNVEAMEMLATCKDALKSLDEDALGRDAQGGWAYRDELIHNINAFLSRHGELRRGPDEKHQ